MEILDVVDENDRVIGQATKEECHNNPSLIHHTVHFALIDKGQKKVLITQRSLSKSHDAGKWCFLGEHILAGESYTKGAKRGVQEELGFSPKKLKELAHNTFHYQQQTEMIRFFAIYYEGEKIDYDQKEIIQLKWLTLEELINARADYSEMTKYWIENINWQEVLED